MYKQGRVAAAAVLGLALTVGVSGVDAQATSGAPLPTPVRPTAPPQQARYDDRELDRVVSPIALYPDPLLAQLFTASTFASQIPLAARWSAGHKELTGQRLIDAVAAEQVSWDPSVQAMLAFPTVLDMMAGDLPWTEELGDAFRTQPADVMDAVQRMRTKAHDYGYLKSNDDMQVSSGETIEILPATPAYIVVPYYDPLVVFYPPRPRVVVSSVIYLGYGVRLGLWFEPWGWGPGGFAWNSRRVVYGYPGWGRPWYGYGGSGRTVFYGSRRSSAVGPGRYAAGVAWSRDRDGRSGWSAGPDRRGGNNDWRDHSGRGNDGRGGEGRSSGNGTWTRDTYTGTAGQGRSGWSDDNRTWSRDRSDAAGSGRTDNRTDNRTDSRNDSRYNGGNRGDTRGGRGSGPSRDVGVVRGGTPPGGGGVRPGGSSGEARSGGASRSPSRGSAATPRGGGSSRGGGVSRGGISRGQGGRSH